MILGGPKDTITSLWTKGLKALVPPKSFGPPTMVGVVVDFKDRATITIKIVNTFFLHMSQTKARQMGKPEKETVDYCSQTICRGPRG